MELDLSLFEISGEDDDSLLRLEDPSDGIFPCSPVHASRSTHPDSAPDSSLVGVPQSKTCRARTVQFAENCGERSIKENIDANADGTRLNVDPMQMKRRNKAKGYNMRKSLAWNKAFFTEEGVLDPDELSLVTGAFDSSNAEPLSVIQEEKKKPGKSCPPHFQSPKEKLSIKSPRLGRGLSPRCDSTTNRVSPAKEIGSPHVRRLVLSAHDVNSKGEKHNDYPRPKPSSSYKRPACTCTLRATSKEPKLTKSLIPRADRCTPPIVSRNAFPKPSCSSRIPRTEPMRVPSSPNTIAVVGKGSLVNTRGLKASVTNNIGVRGNAKSASFPKPSPSKETTKLIALNNSKLPPKALTPRDPQVYRVFGVPDPVHRQDGVSSKHNNIPLPQKYFPDDSKRGVTHIHAGKPSGLRVPSPSLGFFGRPKQSASVRDSRLSNIAEISSNYSGVRNHDVAQRPLQSPELVPRVSNGLREADTREPLFTVPSTSSQEVLANILEEFPRTLSHDFDSNGQKPSKPIKCDEKEDIQALHNYDNLQDNNRSYYELLKSDEHQGKAEKSCREEMPDSLSLGGCGGSEAKITGFSENQQIIYGNQRRMSGTFEEGTERMKSYSSEAHLKRCKEGIDEQMDNCFSAAEPKGPSDHNQPLLPDKQKSLDDRDQPSEERVESSQHDSCEAHRETFNGSLDGCANYDPSLHAESPVLDVKVHRCLLDSPKDCNLSEHNRTYYLSQFKPFIPVAEGNIVEDINNEVQVTHVSTSGPLNVSSLGMLNRNSSISSYSTTDETQLSVSGSKVSESEPNSQGNFQLTSCSSDVLQKPDVPDEDNAAGSSYLKNDQSSFVGADMFAVNILPSPGNHTDSELLVHDRHQNFSESDILLQMSNKYDLVEILNIEFDEKADEAVLLHAQNNEIMLQQSSDQVTVLQGQGSDIYNEEFRTTESENYLDLEHLNLKSTIDREKDCIFVANNESTIVDSDELGNTSSQLEVLEKTNIVCRADAFTTINDTDSLSSDKFSPSDTCSLDSSKNHDMPDAALDVVLQKQSSGLSNNLHFGKLEKNVTETAGAENDTVSNVAVEPIQENTSSDLGENYAQHPCNSTMSNSKPKCIVIKPPPDVVPFSDEWLAAIEAAGEDMLTLKSGAVQHSPTEKSLPEPSPWSPVKRNKNQGIGPFDCTKHTSVPAPPADD